MLCLQVHNVQTLCVQNSIDGGLNSTYSMKYYVCKTKFSFGHLPSGSVLGVLGVKSQMYFSMGFS